MEEEEEDYQIRHGLVVLLSYHQALHLLAHLVHPDHLHPWTSNVPLALILARMDGRSVFELTISKCAFQKASSTTTMSAYSQTNAHAESIEKS